MNFASRFCLRQHASFLSVCYYPIWPPKVKVIGCVTVLVWTDVHDLVWSQDLAYSCVVSMFSAKKRSRRPKRTTRRTYVKLTTRRYVSASRIRALIIHSSSYFVISSMHDNTELKLWLIASWLSDRLSWYPAVSEHNFSLYSLSQWSWSDTLIDVERSIRDRKWRKQRSNSKRGQTDINAN